MGEWAVLEILRKPLPTYNQIVAIGEESHPGAAKLSKATSAGLPVPTIILQITACNNGEFLFLHHVAMLDCLNKHDARDRFVSMTHGDQICVKAMADILHSP